MPAPVHTPAPARVPAPPSGLTTRRIELRGLADVPVMADIAESGRGDPVVFLHGLVGLNDHWENVVRGIDHGARSILLQLPLLELKDDDCSIHGATVLTLRFLEQHHNPARGQTPAVLVGNSFGGHVALKIAIERPELIRGLVLAGASGLIERTIVSDVQLKPSREWMERKIGELFFDKSKMNPMDVDRAHAALTQRAGARAMIKLSKSARRNHLGEEIHRIMAPTLILWGRQDIVTPSERLRRINKG
jgi:pimeloyl-ACP methyl ester carboxylesterase